MGRTSTSAPDLQVRLFRTPGTPGRRPTWTSAADREVRPTAAHLFNELLLQDTSAKPPPQIVKLQAAFPAIIQLGSKQFLYNPEKTVFIALHVIPVTQDSKLYFAAARTTRMKGDPRPPQKVGRGQPGELF